MSKRLVDLASSPYQRAGRFAWYFARNKLAHDPLFETLLRTGAIPPASCLVDLGCGQGLLALWLHAALGASRSTDTRDTWPAEWPAPPKIGTYLGVDQSRRDVARAKAAMPPFGRAFRGDVRTVGMTMLDRCDVVTMFDVLQYLTPQEQEALVTAIAACLPPWGVLVMRVGNGAETLSSRWSNVVDLVVCALRGHPQWRLNRRTLEAWRTLLEGHGFIVEVLDDERSTNSTHARSAFANVLLRASRPVPPHAAHI